MNLLERLGLVKTTLPRSVRQPDRQEVAIAQPMARPSWDQGPFGFVNPFSTVPQHQNLYLYEQLVEILPVINAALSRITQLVGCPKIESENRAAADELMAWWDGLRVNRIQTGGGNWFSGHVLDHLLYGRAHAEIILSATLRDIYAVQELHPRTIELKPRQSRYGVDLVQNAGFGPPIVLNQDLILTTVHDVRQDSPQGNSILFGLPVVAETLNKMLAALKETWERYGVPVYHVRYVPDENLSDPQGTRTRAVASEAITGLESALLSRANGASRDFATVGDVTISIVGAQGEALDIEVPWRSLMEQITARFGLPSWMLGFHWSTTERMSSVEASLLGEMIDEIREHLVSQISYLFRLRQAFVGRPFDFTVCWEAPSLIDQMEQAQAEKAEAEALGATIKANRELWTLGAITDLDFVRRVRPELAEATDEEVRRAAPELLAVPPMPLPVERAPAPFGGGQQDGRDQERPAPSGQFGRSLTYGEDLLVKNGNGRGH